MFEGVSSRFPLTCRDDLVCTIPAIDGGNICFMDEGSPLFKMKCGISEVECLYGVASFHRDINVNDGNDICNGGSYFTSVVKFKEWIMDILIRNSEVLNF